jgi:hypothetical protein
MADSLEHTIGLIRTGLRDRLPRGLSYPTGAEQISHALSDVPQFAELWILFNKHQPGMGIDQPGGLVGFQQVLAAHWHRGGWSLTVFAVQSEERSIVRGLLQAMGLPAVRAWLWEVRPETWFVGMRGFEVGCSLSDPAVGVLESKDHRTLAWRAMRRSESRVGEEAGRSGTAGRPGGRGHS